MKITEIKRRFDLLTKANNENYCLLSELAKELSIKKTDLMQFIEDNYKLFSICAMERKMNNGKFKNLGVAIQNVYLHVDENPITDEWLKKHLEEYKDYIYIEEISNYGEILGYYVKEDKDGKLRENLWRNTKEKIEKLRKQGIIGERTFYIGGYNDSYKRIYDTTLLQGWRNHLKDEGWRCNINIMK